MDKSPPEAIAQPSPLNYIFSFFLVALCWGFTTPFIRKAAISYIPPTPASHPSLAQGGWLYRKAAWLFWTIVSLVTNPRYAIPLAANMTGGIWFFLLVGQAELSLTVSVTNSLAFLFTVLGEWVAEGKTINRDTWIGMACVCAGITLCVIAKL